MSEKYLKRVYLNSDVYAACLQHALSTEKEEVMGLLIGEVMFSILQLTLFIKIVFSGR